MMNIRISLLLSTTILLSGCATVSDRFKEAVAYLFDPQPEENQVQSPDSAASKRVDEDELRAAAQDRQQRQQEQSVNASVLKEEKTPGTVKPDASQEIAHTKSEPSAAVQIEEKAAPAHSEETTKPAQSKPAQEVVNASSDKTQHESAPNASQRKPATNHKENNAATEHHSKKHKKPAREVAPEEDESHYAYRGYQDPLRSGFYPRQTHKKVADYASQLAMELMDKAMGLNTEELVGITSFVRLNTALNDTTILGNQLAELLMTELQAYGVGVVDFKVTDGIRVTPRGDIAMSRSGKRLAQSVQMDHILTGTMIEDSRGVRVNARIVTVSSKRVVASASVHIPAFIVTSLYTGHASAP
ncbi:FlgO family outer membrane protein [Alteromonas ponticola]|uniref:FlgO family outer membrane protein n=1 Tax=Alteromonas aquimaris TaxID=2998417 RepID=A0ABT3P6C4_9ALTE|nr:FlgO family outer membrane protein [Alteromonas aquimaris]MCW8108317.1 FlgO family outer membrane protein [Alteromonas aquimaris]